MALLRGPYDGASDGHFTHETVWSVSEDSL
jgi:hypothetical protein